MKTWIALFLAVLATALLPSAQQHQKANDYWAPVTPAEKQDIAYIITTLANKKGVGLLFKRSALNAAGDRVEHVHPLKFLETIFTDPQLKADMKKVHSKSFVWKNFMDGMGDSLQRQWEAGNITEEYVDDYAEKVKVPANILWPLAEKQKWNDFVIACINN